MRFSLAAILATIASLALAACGGVEDPVSGEPPAPPVYQISNADGQVEGWMLGTIHALPDGLGWRSDNTEYAVREADLLMVEVPNLDDRGAIARVFAELATTEGMGPLSGRVSAELAPTVERMIARSDYRPDDFLDTEDWAAAIMLAQVDAPGDPRNGVDRALIRDFSEREVRGFETAEGQLGIFDQLAADDQRELLEGTVRDWIESRDNPQRLMEAWRTGDVPTLEAETASGIMADPELREALLVGRNEAWIGPLEDVLQSEERPLVAVGTAHLIGPDGLNAMLEARGYVVTRLD